MSAHPGRGLDRVIAFSDGVVAIAITLLVLPLTEISPSEYDGDLGALISANSSALIAFAVSFFVIAMFWLSHHRIFDRLVAIDGPLLRLNLLWLLCIVFLPFPTSLQQNDAEKPFTVFYLAWLLVTAVATRMLGMYVERHPELTDAPPDAASRHGSIRGWVAVVLFAVALAVSLVSATAGLYALMLLALVGPISSMLARGGDGA